MSRVPLESGEYLECAARLADALRNALDAIRVVQRKTRVLTAVAPLGRPDLLSRATEDLETPLRDLTAAHEALVDPTTALAGALGAPRDTPLGQLADRFATSPRPVWADLARDLLMECGRLSAKRGDVGTSIDRAKRSVEHDLADALGSGTSTTYGSDGHRSPLPRPLVSELL